jgi:hypothetical protein
LPVIAGFCLSCHPRATIYLLNVETKSDDWRPAHKGG